MLAKRSPYIGATRRGRPKQWHPRAVLGPLLLWLYPPSLTGLMDSLISQRPISRTQAVVVGVPGLLSPEDLLELSLILRTHSHPQVSLSLWRPYFHYVQGSAMVPVTRADNTGAIFDTVSVSSPRYFCTISVRCLGSHMLIFLLNSSQRHFPLGSPTAHSPVQIFLPSLGFIPVTPQLVSSIPVCLSPF